MAERKNKVASNLRSFEKSGIPQTSFNPDPNFLDHQQPDPEGIKDERVALAAIIGARVSVRAIRIIETGMPEVRQPSVEQIDSLEVDHEDKLLALKIKMRGIKVALLIGFGRAILEEEEMFRETPQHKAAPVYKRLEQMISPASETFTLGRDKDFTKKHGMDEKTMTPVWRYMMFSLTPLYNNLINMIDDVSQQSNASVKEITHIIGNSYLGYINKISSHHKDTLDEAPRISQQQTYIHNRHLNIKPEILETLEDIEAKGHESVTTGCSLKVPASLVAPFLDEPPTEPNYLKATFDFAAGLLAA
ncbi:MAG TPA: hypothetical protein VLE91_03270 [Candidatus Saccharimonadales bacterium]|nr:hypothetical protein [Candidatus Saccharimonadales bacterium]